MIATGLQTASRAHNHGKQPTEAIISKKKVINYFYGELDTEENLNIRRYLTGEKDRFNRRPQSAAGALYQPLDASTVGACAIPVGLLGCLQALRNDSGPVRNDSGPVRNDSGSEQGGIGNDREPKDPSVCKPKPFPLQAATYKEEARPVEGPVPPRPAYGHNKDGRDDLKQVLLSLGVNSDGLPLRLGIRDGNTSDSTETPVAIEECVALGLDGVRGIVADSKAYCKRTLGLCLEQRVGLITLVPRTCAVRPELEAWGQQHSPLPLLLEKPGRTRQEPPRRWHGHSVVRQVEVEYAEGRLALAELRFLVVHSSQLAQHAAVAYSAAQAKEGERVAEHIQRVEARWFACAADAEAAITDYEGRGQGRRGRKPRLWRFHTLHYRVEAGSFPKKRTHRGRPPKAEAPQVEVRYRLVVHTEALVPAEDAHGWTVLATTVQPEGCSDAEILQAYQEQNTTVEPGFRWIKNPAAISPVWLEKPERIAALAMLTVVGLLVYAVIQRQVRRYLCDHDRHIPGNKGPTAMPTAAVVFALFTPVMRVHFAVDTAPSFQVHGVQDYHLIVCDAVGIDQPWYQGRAAGQNSLPWTTPP
jgi:transposase